MYAFFAIIFWTRPYYTDLHMERMIFVHNVSKMEILNHLKQVLALNRKEKIRPEPSRKNLAREEWIPDTT